MKILGFYCGHDSSISTYDTESNQLRYLKLERESGIKHHCVYKQSSTKMNSKTESVLNFVKTNCVKWNFRPDVIVFSDGWKTGLGGCGPDNFYESWDNKIFVDADISDNNCKVYCIDHHYAHILSCWPVKSTKEVTIGISLDNGGDNGWTGRIIATPEAPRLIHNDFRSSVGLMLVGIGREMMKLEGSGLDIAGKVMGAQAYGKLDDNIVNSINMDLLFQDIAHNWQKYKPDNCVFGDYQFNNWLATMHHLSEQYILKIFDTYCSNNDVVTYSGGIAQNTVTNQLLCSKYNVSIPPHCYDGGISIGCLELARIIFKLPEFSTNGFPYWQADICTEVPTSDTIRIVANALTEGQIVGWFQGRGEIGPRSLGNRSILMDPRIPDGKDIINQKVKNREFWRPYAPSVLEEESSLWFGESNSPYMLKAVNSNTTLASKIPAVVHVDNTSRVQTVNRSQNQIFYDLIQQFYKITGVPMLLNTSLNSGGSPIFSNKSQCMELLNQTSLDIMCIGNKIHRKLKLL